MGSMTYFVVLPFMRDEDGELVPGEPMEAQSADAAKRRARSMAEAKGGAVAFSRTGEPTTGDFEDAVVLGRYGEVPEVSELG